MKPKPKRFSSRKAIIAAIDDETFLRDRAIKMAGDYEVESARLREWFAKHPPESAVTEPQKVEWKYQIDRLNMCKNEGVIRRRAIPGHEAKLRQLKEALAEFDTEPMPFLMDHSVSL